MQCALLNFYRFNQEEQCQSVNLLLLPWRDIGHLRIANMNAKTVSQPQQVPKKLDSRMLAKNAAFSSHEGEQSPFFSGFRHDSEEDQQFYEVALSKDRLLALDERSANFTQASSSFNHLKSTLANLSDNLELAVKRQSATQRTPKKEPERRKPAPDSTVEIPQINDCSQLQSSGRSIGNKSTTLPQTLPASAPQSSLLSFIQKNPAISVNSQCNSHYQVESVRKLLESRDACIKRH